MGREVRMVPADWQHPRDEHGKYRPLYGRSFRDSLDRWNSANTLWMQGLQEDYSSNIPGATKNIDPEYAHMSYSEWDGDQPKSESYNARLAGVRAHALPDVRGHFRGYAH